MNCFDCFIILVKMALIIGHSQVKYFGNYVQDSSIQCLFKSGCCVEDLVTLPFVKESIPASSVIAVHCGINNLPFDSVETLLEKYQRFYGDIKELNPTATVIFSSILPRAQSEFPEKVPGSKLQCINNAAKRFNSSLQAVSDFYPDIQFLSHDDVFMPDGVLDRQMLSRDGLHLSFRGTKTLVDRIVGEIRRNLTEIEAPATSTLTPTENPATPTSIETPANSTLAPTENPSTPTLIEKEAPASSTLACTKSPVTSTLVPKENTATPTSIAPTENPATPTLIEVKAPSTSNLASKENPATPTLTEAPASLTLAPTENPTTPTSIETEAPAISTLASVTTPATPRLVSFSLIQFKTPWWHSVLTPNMFENLSIDDGDEDDDEEDDNEDGYNAFTSVVTSQCQATLTGGGGDSCDESLNENEDDDDFSSVIYMNCETKLKHSEAANILNNPDIKKVSKFPPFKPKSGTVYLITDGQNTQHKDDWRADGYTWRNYGKSKVTDGDRILEKSYFRIKNGKEESDQFQRVMIRFYGSDYNHLTIVQYLGDENEYKGEPHGNRKNGTKPHQRTMPSVLNKIKGSGDENPKSVKNKLDSESSVPLKLTGIGSVRNNKQVENVQYNIRKERKLGQDPVYNLLELVHHLDCYIHEIKTTPDLQVIIGNKEIFEEFDRLIQLKTSDPIPLYYDTTFCLGDFYVSTLAFQHVMFEENPVIPLAFMVHERKFQKCHEQFFDIVREKIPRIDKKNVPIVTDREKGIINAIEKILPNSHLLICWNHILRDLKFWLTKHGGMSKDLQIYDNHVKQLLQSETVEDFEMLYEKLKLTWSIPMVNYFEENLQETITKHAGRWVLEKIDLYNPYSGITNNCSESLNAKLKRLTEWKERDVDNIVLYFYYMQSNDLAELMKSFCGIGEFNILKKYRYALRDPETVILPKRVCHPEKIVEMIKGEIQALNRERQSNDLLIEKNNNSVDSEVTENENNDSGQTGRESIKCAPRIKQNLSQKSLAQHTLNEQGITLVPEMKCFVVRGSRGQKYAVTLFPKETCQCPSTRRCHHILAAMMAIGFEPNEDKKVANLTQLRKNSRARKDKKAGTKRGRKGDVEDTSIIAAPDSILMNNSVRDRDLSFGSDKGSLSHSTPKPTKINCPESEEYDNPSPPYVHETPKLTPKVPKVVIVSPGRTPKSILKKSKKNLFETDKSEMHSVKRRKLELPPKPSSVVSDHDQEVLFNDSRNDSLNEEIPYVDIADENISKSELFWVKDLGLTLTDKELILNNGKLNSQIMEAINIIARKQFPSISGLQLPEKVPKYISKEQRWHIQPQAAMNHIPNDKTLSCQIHHTGRDHWVVSFRDETDSIFIFDSLGFDRAARFIMTPSLSIQLGLIYGKNTDQDLEIILIETQKQTNGVDCGIFAIAHLVEFCSKGVLNPNICFDTKNMRPHLLQCLETGVLSCFPTVHKRQNIRNRSRTKHKSVPINLHCKCRLPACVGDMIKCEICRMRFHKYCVKDTVELTCPTNRFVCEKCLE